MINWSLLKDELEIKTGLSYYDSRKTELICKCPKCEIGSKKNKGHLYIQINDSAPVFNCFKCGFKGNILTLLKFLSIQKENIIQGEISFRSTNRHNILNDKNLLINPNKLFFEKIEDCEPNFISKVNYLKQRISFDIDLSLIPNLVLNIKNFVRINDIDIKQIKPEFFEFLDRNFVGFVCNRESIMVLRNIDVNSDFRFYNMKLTNNLLDLKDFYGIKTNYYNENEYNTIVLCEGVFDLLVSYYSKYFEDLKQISFFWAAILNNHYDNTAFSVLEYCKLTKSNFVILSDNNVKESNYYNLSKKDFVNKLEIYWNKQGKDFGQLPIERIKTSFDKKFFKR